MAAFVVVSYVIYWNSTPKISKKYPQEEEVIAQSL